MSARVENGKIKNVMDIYDENVKNENRERLFDLCEQMKLKINNTFFPAQKDT